MKKYYLFLIIAVIAVLGAIIFFATFSGRNESVDLFDAEITVNDDGSVNVTETIQYNSDGIIKHGILRNIPLLSYSGKTLDISEISIKDENGLDYPYAQSRQGSEIFWKIGDPNTTFSGEKTYVISYKIQNSLGFFDEYDEIYWNVTGNEWPFSIKKAIARVILPAGVTASQYSCYEGLSGEKNKCSSVVKEDGTIEFESGELGLGEGMTVAVGFPKDNVEYPVEETFVYEDDHVFLLAYTSDEEVINSFHSDIYVKNDSSIKVVETIEYDSGSSSRHGIFRLIPLISATNKKIKINDVSILDEEGNEYIYDESNTGFSPKIREWKIGNPNATFEGERTYIISYTVKNTLSELENIDEIYWNVTGNDWKFPIKSATANVILPDGVLASQHACYEGLSGEKNKCSSIDNEDGIVEFESGELGFGEGMTVAVGFPKGNVIFPALYEKIIENIVGNLVYLIPLLIVLLIFRKKIVIFFKSRKYYRDNPIVVEYEIKDFSPIEVSAIVNGYVSDKHISAQIVWLAVNGYVKIKADNGVFLFEKTEHIDDLDESNKELLECIDGKSDKDFTTTEYGVFERIDKNIIRNLDSLGYTKSPRIMKLNGSIFSASIIFFAVFLAINPGVFIWLICYQSGLDALLGFIWSGTFILMIPFIIIFSKRQISITEKGIELERRFLGVKKYIEVAEKDRIEFHNAPAKTPVLFEKLLPFAMIFGQENKWAKEFEDIYVNYTPEWYLSNNNFSSISFANSLGAFSSSVHSLAPKPSSGSGGSSGGGSSGGGSSGGGGGGGGGGSW